MPRFLLVGPLVLLTLAPAVFAQTNESGVTRAAESPARVAATRKRRAWLSEQLTAGLSDRERIAEINSMLGRLSHKEVDKLAVLTLESRDQDRSRRNLMRALAELERATAVRDELRRRVAASRRGAPGFRPVITWLPEGASLTASAVVSPDRRSVRINALPFFSQVGPVDTFNFFTGETRRLRQFDPPPPPQIWYDGFRTRYGRRPGR